MRGSSYPEDADERVLFSLGVLFLLTLDKSDEISDLTLVALIESLDRRVGL